MRGTLLAGLIGSLLMACGESGPSPEEVAKMKTEKECSKLYGTLVKEMTDQLHKNGVSGVELGEKDGFVDLCAGSGFTEEQLRCLDPNRGGTEECKKELESVAEKTKKLSEYLLAPMKEKADKAKAKAKAK